MQQAADIEMDLALPDVPKGRCVWLPHADTMLSLPNHVPLVNLSVFEMLKAQLQEFAQLTPGQQHGLNLWCLYNSINTPDQIRSIDSREGNKPVISAHRNNLLRRLFWIFDAYFFDGELERSGRVDVRWTYAGPEFELGRTDFDFETRRASIKIRGTPNVGLYRGREAMHLIATLLHEMAHAYIEVHKCRCDSCKPEFDAGCEWEGFTGHGNVWLSLVRLIERVANWSSFFPWDLDINWRWAYDREVAARLGRHIQDVNAARIRAQFRDSVHAIARRQEVGEINLQR